MACLLTILERKIIDISIKYQRAGECSTYYCCTSIHGFISRGPHRLNAYVAEHFQSFTSCAVGTASVSGAHRDPVKRDKKQGGTAVVVFFGLLYLQLCTLSDNVHCGALKQHEKKKAGKPWLCVCFFLFSSSTVVVRFEWREQEE